MYDLKAAQMNVQCSLIWELMLYEFKLGNNGTEATKNICVWKVKAQLIAMQLPNGLRNFVA